MNEAEILIKSMAKDGSTARAIATELHARGIRTAGRAFSPDMIEGFLRHLGIGVPPAVLPPAAEISPYSKDAEPIGDPLPKVRMLRPWPSGIDYGGIKGGENGYPLYDVPPYCYTHQPRYTGSPLRGASSAAYAALGGW